MKKSILFFVVIVMGCLEAKDVKDSKDHELFSRYPGFYIKDYKVLEYDEAQVIIGKFDHHKNKALTKAVEGKVTNIDYQVIKREEDTSLFQLYKNYEKALKKHDAKVIFSCRDQSCFVDEKGAINGVFLTNWIHESVSLFKGLYGDVRDNLGVITAEIPREEKEPVTVSFVMSTAKVNGDKRVLVSIIEPKDMDTDKIGIGTVSDVEKKVAQEGKVTLEGIYFDFDKAVIKVESKETLAVISEYLRKHSKESFYIVGHTDNKGSYGHNMELSKKRANAVYTYLKTKSKVKNKLQAIGIGPISPVVSNDSEEGREKNRRVELVLMR